jgi:hypothetical protein
MGETVIVATVTVAGSALGTLSNEYGFYSLTLARGNYAIQVSVIGMNTGQVQVVTVTTDAPGRRLKNPQMSIERINVQEIKNIHVIW